MRTIRMFSLLALVASMSVMLHAQAKPTPAPPTKPNFTGTWVFASGDDGRVDRGAVSIGLEFTANQTDKTLTVIGSTPTQKYIHQLDGSVYQDGPVALKTKWDGSSLVITSAVGNVTRTQTWSLDASGGRLTIVTVLGLNQDRVQTVIYQKK